MKRPFAYIIDTDPGLIHRQITIQPLGSCREQFAQLVRTMELHDADVVVVFKAEFLFLDTSPAWMEKFIAAAQRYGITVIDTSREYEYDLRAPGDETNFRALRSR